VPPDISAEGTVEGKRRACPGCGTPFPAGEHDGGCPVSLLRQAIQADTIDDALFDHYELVRRQDGTFEELGPGSMGVTYRAFDTVLQNKSGLK
jgi:hypothetical protein